MLEKKAQIENKAKEYIKMLGFDFTLSFKKLGATAGIAYMRKNHIELNEGFLVDNFDDMLSNTLPHEIAHLVAYKRYGGDVGHSVQWKHIMRELGVNPSRCHNYNLEAVYHDKAICDCKIHHVSRRLYNIIKNKGNKICSSCRTSLVAWIEV